MMQNCYEFDNSNYSSSTTKDENEPELEALERSSSTTKDLNQQPKRSSQPHVSYGNMGSGVFKRGGYTIGNIFA